MTPEKQKKFLDRLHEAKFSGALRVEFEGRKVEYRSLAELDKAISDLEAQMGAAPRTTVTHALFTRD